MAIIPEWKIIRGNTSIQDIAVRDKDGALVTNLAAAVEIKFAVKETEEGAELITKTAASAGGIDVDTPSQGYLRITIDPADTFHIDPARYYMALQIMWSSVLIYELKFRDANGVETDRFEIEQDIITT